MVMAGFLAVTLDVVGGPTNPSGCPELVAVLCSSSAAYSAEWLSCGLWTTCPSRVKP